METPRTWRWSALVGTLLLVAGACDTAESPTDETARETASLGGPDGTASATAGDPDRGYAMGFTPYPHDGGLQGLQDALGLIETEGDLAAMHYDGGVPWVEALAGAPWPAAYRAEVEGKANAVPSGHEVYLAVTPISFERDAMAPYSGADGVVRLPEPWNAYPLNHPDVIEAYGAFVLRMVDLYDPDYFAYAIEPNLFAENRPGDWPAFVELAASTYQRVKAAHPDLPTFVSIQAEWFHRAPAAQTAFIADLLPYTDLIAISSYPYIDSVVASAMPDDYFEVLRALAPEKPFAVAETGWPAEPVGAPYPAAIASDEAAQAAFVDWLLADAERADAAFVTWFLPRDLDGQWEAGLSTLPVAPTARLFRDNGLFAGDGTPRAALDRWREAFAE